MERGDPGQLRVQRKGTTDKQNGGRGQFRLSVGRSQPGAGEPGRDLLPLFLPRDAADRLDFDRILAGAGDGPGGDGAGGGECLP